ncbi:MAG: hypothetical protein KKA84_06905 [Bacteroidetes bacterium]|nr:hypothetical protein [Bacteroidota bacterium]
MYLRKLVNSVLIFLSFVVFSSCQGDNTDDNIVNPPESTNNRWEQVASFGGRAVGGAASFTIGTNAYVVSGNTGNQLLNQVYQYNSSANTWAVKSNFPGSYRLDCNGFTIGGKGYVCLGSDNRIMLSDIWEYDPQNDTWSRKADFPGGARLLATAIVINQKAYIIAGSTSYPSGQQNDVWEYDPQTDQWTQKNDFPGVARSSAVGFTIGNKGYVGTGIIAAEGYTTAKDFWEYDQPTDTWTRKVDLPGIARGYAQAFAIGNKGYIALGMNDINSSGTVLTLTKDIWEFDPQSNAWTEKTIFPGSGRAMAVSFVIDSFAYIGLGNRENVSTLNDFWKFRP